MFFFALAFEVVAWVSRPWRHTVNIDTRPDAYAQQMAEQAYIGVCPAQRPHNKAPNTNIKLDTSYSNKQNNKLDKHHNKHSQQNIY